jgi:hypothetical protein
MASKLFVQRLFVLTRNGHIAYDEQFHKGVNIIRGENSSGKSTITHLLFYGLGGSYVDFVPQAKKCQYVYVEVCISECVVTFRREIKLTDEDRVESMSGMQIFWGDLSEALSGECDSQFFGYKTTENTKSFSNALFEIFGFPLVVGDNNITIHQLLRLMYIDQESPTGSLFMFEVFDSQITRETVAELLMGIYDSELYTAKLSLRDMQRQLSDINVEIKAVKAALPRAEESSSVFLQSIINNKEEEIQELSNIIYNKRAGIVIKTPKINLMLDYKKKVANLRKLVDEQQERVERITNEVEDTTLFIQALKKRRTALNNSIQIRKGLENFVLEFCPECLTKLNDNVADGHCRLCKAPIDNTRGVRQAKRYDLEMSFQIKESELVLEESKHELVTEKAKLQGLKTQLATHEKLLKNQLKDVRSPQDEEIDGMIYTKGLLEGEILQYRTMLEKAVYYENLLHQKSDMEKAIAKTERFINAKQSQKNSKKTEVENKIKEFGIYFLQHDLQRQQEFTNADDFYVDFSNNIVYLSNKHSKYSASSNFYLKIVARFALFMASLELPFMRYPHFIFADNMEDKGIEEIRAQNFQRVLIEKLSNYSNNEYQVIYTTSYITEELDNSPYVIGTKYSKEHKSLNNVQ